MPYSPFQNYSSDFRKTSMWLFGTSTILLLIAIKWLDTFLITKDTPDGIIGFELVKNIHDARIMLDIWGDTGRIVAAFSLGIDYLFLISYSLFFGIISYELGKKFKDRLNLLSKTGFVFSWLILLAGLYDAIENFALFKIMTGCQLSIWATTAWFFATIKFTIVYLVIAYILISLIFLLILPKQKSVNN